MGKLVGLRRHDWTFSPNPQSTCRLVGWTPMNHGAPGGECEAGSLFYHLTISCIVPLESEANISAVSFSPAPSGKLLGPWYPSVPLLEKINHHPTPQSANPEALSPNLSNTTETYRYSIMVQWLFSLFILFSCSSHISEERSSFTFGPFEKQCYKTTAVLINDVTDRRW